MNLLQRRETLDWFVCAAVSCISHLVVLILIALLWISVADDRPQALEVEAVRADAPPNLVTIDSVRVEKIADTEASWTAVPLPTNRTSLEVGAPWDHADSIAATTGLGSASASSTWSANGRPAVGLGSSMPGNVTDA